MNAQQTLEGIKKLPGYTEPRKAIRAATCYLGHALGTLHGRPVGLHKPRAWPWDVGWNPSPDYMIDIEVASTLVSWAFSAGVHHEVETLRAWKEEAKRAMSMWDEVHVAVLNSPRAILGKYAQQEAVRLINEPDTELLRKAFILGFMVSREGFNAECFVEELSDGLAHPVTRSDALEDLLNDNIATSNELSSLSNEAARRLSRLSGMEQRKGKWVILFTSEEGNHNDWFEFEGTYKEAEQEATFERRHTNYGRTGYMIIPNN